jgi:hypothetical protein
VDANNNKNVMIAWTTAFVGSIVLNAMAVGSVASQVAAQ